MSHKYWLITNRNRTASGFGGRLAKRTYWVADEDPENVASWTQVEKGAEFERLLLEASDQFPRIREDWLHERQKHVTFFIHGYNNTWAESVRRYQKVSRALYEGQASLGIPVLYAWPSDGELTGYLPDRADARAAAEDLADVLWSVHTHLLAMQRLAASDPAKACKAKVSIIAHSMGNYLLQKAMKVAWQRANQPQLSSLVNQLLMVAADVDNDLFSSGDRQEDRDGDAIANLTYRITSLFSGRDSVLGVSAGLKHFGKRRLGRSGLDTKVPVPDNVWEHDCSDLIPANEENVHSAYFEHAATFDLMRQVLCGVDRTVIAKGLAT